MTENNNEANQITANALIRKRADVLFEIGEHEQAIKRLQTELVHLDAVLRMFRPDFVAEELLIRHRRPIRSPYFRRGELSQRIYDVLREQGEITAADVAVKAMRDKGLDPDSDRATRADFARRVGLQLNAMQRKGKVERIGKGRALRWTLKGNP